MWTGQDGGEEGRMPNLVASQPCKRYGTFGNPNRKLTQTEVDWRNKMHRDQKKKRRVKEKPTSPAPASTSTRSAERGGADGSTSRGQTRGNFFGFMKRSATPAAEQSRTPPAEAVKTPDDYRTAILTELGRRNRTVPPVWEPNRHEERARAASEPRSAGSQESRSMRRGFGFRQPSFQGSEPRSPESILVPPRERTTVATGEKTAPWRHTPAPVSTQRADSHRKSAANAADEQVEYTRLARVQRRNASQVPPHDSRAPSAPHPPPPHGGDATAPAAPNPQSEVKTSGADANGDIDVVGLLEEVKSGSNNLIGLTYAQLTMIEAVLAARQRLREEAGATAHLATTTTMTATQTAPSVAAPELSRPVEALAASEVAMPAARSARHSVPSKVEVVEQPAVTAAAPVHTAKRLSSPHAALPLSPTAVVAPEPVRPTTPPSSQAVSSRRVSKRPSPLHAEIIVQALLPTPARPPTPLHATESARHVPRVTRTVEESVKAASETDTADSVLGSIEEVCPPPRRRRGKLLSGAVCTGRRAARSGVADKRTGMRRAGTYPDAHNTEGYGGAAHGTIAPPTLEEACRQYAEQCQREEELLRQSMQRQRQRDAAGPTASERLTAVEEEQPRPQAPAERLSVTVESGTALAPPGGTSSPSVAEAATLRRRSAFRLGGVSPPSTPVLHRASADRGGGAARHVAAPYSFLRRMTEEATVASSAEMPRQQTPLGPTVSATGASGVACTPPVRRISAAHPVLRRTWSVELTRRPVTPPTLPGARYFPSFTSTLFGEASVTETSLSNSRSGSLADRAFSLHCLVTHTPESATRGSVEEGMQPMQLMVPMSPCYTSAGSPRGKPQPRSASRGDVVQPREAHRESGVRWLVASPSVGDNNSMYDAPSILEWRSDGSRPPQSADKMSIPPSPSEICMLPY